MKRIIVPKLDIDGAQSQPLRPSQVLERRIVAHLIAHLKSSGFALDTVYDGEETTGVREAKEAMELIFNLDQASVRFQLENKKGERLFSPHGVLLVLGNGEDIISDWNYMTGDHDGFNAAMEAFKIEEAF